MKKSNLICTCMLRRNVSKFSHKINVRRKEVDYTRIFDILKYYYSSQLRVCMCGNSLANVLFSLVYLYLTYVCYLVSRQERLGERMYYSNVMCNIIYVCVTSHVQNHVVKVFQQYMCSTCDCESIYFTWEISHLLFMLDKSNPETFQMVVCCISFFFNSTFICFFFLFMKVNLLLFYCTTCYRVIWCSHRCSIEHQINIWTILMHTEFLVDII